MHREPQYKFSKHHPLKIQHFVESFTQDNNTLCYVTSKWLVSVLICKGNATFHPECSFGDLSCVEGFWKSVDGIQEEAWVVCSFGFFCCPLSSCCHCHSKDVCLLTQQLLFLFFYNLLLQMCINFNHIIHVPNRCLAWKRQLSIKLKRKCQFVTLDFHSHSRAEIIKWPWAVLAFQILIKWDFTSTRKIWSQCSSQFCRLNIGYPGGG